jgi:Transcriptional regulators
MVNALILLNVDRDKVNEVAEKLSEIQGVSEVYSVAGRYDLAAVVRAKDNDHLADLVTGTLLRIEGIQKSETLFAFRVYSKHDLDRMFSI